MRVFSLPTLPDADPTEEGQLGYDHARRRIGYHDGNLPVWIGPEHTENTYTCSGPLTEPVLGQGKWVLRSDWVFSSADVSFAVASATDVLIDPKCSGDPLYGDPLRVPAGAELFPCPLPSLFSYPSGSVMTVDIVSPGSGASTLSFTLRLTAV